MADGKVKIPERPKVHFTANGAPYIDPKEILSTKAGQDIILAMAKLAPISNKSPDETTSPKVK